MNKLVIVLCIVAAVTISFVAIGLWFAPDDEVTKILSLDPKKAIDYECTPHTTPVGAKIKIISADGTVFQFWNFDCNALLSVIEAVDEINRAYCIAGSTSFNGSHVGFSGVNIKFENSSDPKGIRLSTSDGSFLFPCGKWVNELLTKLAQAFSSCCG